MQRGLTVCVVSWKSKVGEPLFPEEVTAKLVPEKVGKYWQRRKEGCFREKGVSGRDLEVGGSALERPVEFLHRKAGQVAEPEQKAQGYQPKAFGAVLKCPWKPGSKQK